MPQLILRVQKQSLMKQNNYILGAISVGDVISMDENFFIGFRGGGERYIGHRHNYSPLEIALGSVDPPWRNCR